MLLYQFVMVVPV